MNEPTDSRDAYLRESWHSLATGLGLKHPENEDAFRWLMECYHETQRHYHTHRHIEALLRLADAHSAHLKNPEMVRLAIWFHDCIYDVMNPFENETRSAVAAGEWLERMGAASLLTEKVKALILATRNHSLAPEVNDSDGTFFLDADLSILGASGEEYDEYALQIRAEFSWVPEAGYNAARREAMQGFLQRPRIFLTDLFFEKWEQKARENIKREIERLAMDAAKG